eukprot:2059193-Prymnesium_polylepis.1
MSCSAGQWAAHTRVCSNASSSSRWAACGTPSGPTPRHAVRARDSSCAKRYALGFVRTISSSSTSLKLDHSKLW